MTYEFATTGGHQGRFTYDDARVAVQQTSLASPDRSLSFELDGRSFDDIALVLDNDNFRYIADLVYLTATNEGVALQLYAWGDLFGSDHLSELNGRNVINFTDPTFNRTRLRIGQDSFFVTRLEQVATIPEPGTGTTMLMAVAACGGLLVARRRRA
ncbi:MAG: PEP-CTERM sorting domain-containing protein [Rubrivivax sp.]|nr:MAG: PEP-CTERM sorting domain-containing protein [Rubrivivax sp.]